MKPFLISIAILMVAAPVAEAAKFRGQTSQDRRAVVVTEDGAPARITILWRARCGEGYPPLWDGTSFLPPYKESTATYVRDGGRPPYTTQVKDEQGRTYRVDIIARVRARRVTRGEWRGRFRVVEAEIRRNGRVVTRCSTRRLRWRATR